MVLARLNDRTIEIRDLDDLARIVETAREQESDLTISDDESEIIVPASAEISDEDLEAFLAAAGALKGEIDPEEIKRNFYDARGQAPRNVDRLFNLE